MEGRGARGAQGGVQWEWMQEKASEMRFRGFSGRGWEALRGIRALTGSERTVWMV